MIKLEVMQVYCAFVSNLRTRLDTARVIKVEEKDEEKEEEDI